jgi:nucleoid DNA-binding protein
MRMTLAMFKPTAAANRATTGAVDRASGCVMTIFDQIGLAPEKGRRVELRGFGTFTIKRDGPTVHNPRNGAAIAVDAKVLLPLFKACRELRAPAPQPDCGHFRKRALCGNVAANRRDGPGCLHGP